MCAHGSTWDSIISLHQQLTDSALMLQPSDQAPGLRQLAAACTDCTVQPLEPLFPGKELTIYEVSICPAQDIIYQHSVTLLSLRAIAHDELLYTHTISCLEELWQRIVCSQDRICAAAWAAAPAAQHNKGTSLVRAQTCCKLTAVNLLCLTKESLMERAVCHVDYILVHADANADAYDRRQASTLSVLD